MKKLRISKIEKPNKIFVKVIYLFSKMFYGKVITPIKIIYSRNPSLLYIAYKVLKTEQKKINLSKEMKYLIHVYTSMLNDCPFCIDINKAEAVKNKIGTEKFIALNKLDKKVLSKKEIATLEYVKESNNKKVNDKTFEKLKNYYSEREIVDITWCVAASNYFNVLLTSLGIESDNLFSDIEKRKYDYSY